MDDISAVDAICAVIFVMSSFVALLFTALFALQKLGDLVGRYVDDYFEKIVFVVVLLLIVAAIRGAYIMFTVPVPVT